MFNVHTVQKEIWSPCLSICRLFPINFFNKSIGNTNDFRQTTSTLRYQQLFRDAVFVFINIVYCVILRIKRFCLLYIEATNGKIWRTTAVRTRWRTYWTGAKKKINFNLWKNVWSDGETFEKLIDVEWNTDINDIANIPNGNEKREDPKRRYLRN